MHIKFTNQIVVNYHVLELIEDENHLMVNKEIHHDNFFHRYNLHTVHEEIELQQQKINLIKYTDIFEILPLIKTYKQIKQKQVHQIQSNNYMINS
jgi:hypothetical protein